MSATTSIEWTDRTWNPVTGCRKVSPGCKHCYAEGVAHRFWGTQYPAVPVGPSLPDGGPTAWRERQFTDVMTHEDRLLEPLSWRKPAKVFVNSMSDLFHEDVPDAFIDQVFAVMALCPQHTFQVLTKRPERMLQYLTRPGAMCSREASVNGAIWSTLGTKRGSRIRHGGAWRCTWPLPNVWLGVSVEDQHRANERIPLLLQTPAAVRFISAEPLLGPLLLPRGWLGQTADCDSCQVINVRVDEDGCCQGCGSDATLRYGLDWVIVGGESGPGARPCHEAWVRSIVQQCQAAGTPVFVKQLGAFPIWSLSDGRPANGEGGTAKAARTVAGALNPKCADPSEWPEDLRVREFPR